MVRNTKPSTVQFLTQASIGVVPHLVIETEIQIFGHISSFSSYLLYWNASVHSVGTDMSPLHHFTHPAHAVVSKILWDSLLNHFTVPLAPYLSDDTFSGVLVVTLWLNDMIINVILPNMMNEICLFAILFLQSIKS